MIPVTYGINPPEYDNGEYQSDRYGNQETISKVSEDLYIKVTVARDGSVGFGVSRSDTEFLGRRDPDLPPSTNPFKIFNIAINIAIDMVRRMNISIIRFEGASSKHSQIYDRIVNSDRFKDLITSHGYRYFGKYRDEHIIVKDQ